MVSKTIRDNWISSAGPAVDEFESLISKEVNDKYALATITGSLLTLHLALKILILEEEIEVLVPDLTFLTTINAVIVSGADPILVDIDNETWTLDIEATKKAILKFKPESYNCSSYARTSSTNGRIKQTGFRK